MEAKQTRFKFESDSIPSLNLLGVLHCHCSLDPSQTKSQSSALRDRQLGMQVTEVCRDLSASRPPFALDFENSRGYSLWLAVNLVTLEHGAGESLEGFVLRKLEGGLKEKERRCLNAKEVSLPPSHPRFCAPSLTRSTRSFLPISNKTYLEQRLMRISSAAR